MKKHSPNSSLPQTTQPPTLEFLVGNIASGKSTWTGTRADQGWLTIENDSLLRSLHGGRYAWEEQIPGLLDVLAKEIISAAAAASRSVVVDSTNRTKARRAALACIGSDLGMRVRIVVFPREPAEVHAERRFKSDPRGRNRDYWLGVARMMEAEWEEPTQDEADEILRLSRDWMRDTEMQRILPCKSNVLLQPLRR